MSESKIQITMNWKTTAGILCENLLHGTDGNTKKESREELVRMAGLLDDQLATRVRNTLIADGIESGLSADIFYDAHEFDDEEAGKTIEDFQQACMAAVKLLRE